uniref:Peptidase M20 dimerisation domain-containing protein n=1 Tax=Amphiprion ocellaris TaxID=80972 RepID=A0AAQ5ZF44_AMPOC
SCHNDNYVKEIPFSFVFNQITVLGTPAEESFGGKVKLIEAEAFADIDLVFMAHPGQQDVLLHSTVTVTYHGKASHASAYPWEGVNALDAAVLAYNISVLRQQLRPKWKLHSIIQHGGPKPNIIPDYTELLFYLRTPHAKDICDLKAKTEAYLSLGIQFEEPTNHITASTDFGNVSFIVPGIHPFFYICTDAFNHTKEYIQAMFLVMKLNSKALAMTAVDVVCSPDLLRQVREDFCPN